MRRLQRLSNLCLSMAMACLLPIAGCSGPPSDSAVSVDGPYPSPLVSPVPNLISSAPPSERIPTGDDTSDILDSGPADNSLLLPSGSDQAAGASRALQNKETAPVSRPTQRPSATSAPGTPSPAPSPPQTNPAGIAITLTINGTSYSATLLDNETTRALTARFPLTLEMSELHGNEKYYYMGQALPTEEQRPGQIRSGDLMLYGSDCLVLFYDSFSTPYAYTRLGDIDDPSGLAQAVGTGSATVTFHLA